MVKPPAGSRRISDSLSQQGDVLCVGSGERESSDHSLEVTFPVPHILLPIAFILHIKRACTIAACGSASATGGHPFADLPWLLVDTALSCPRETVFFFCLVSLLIVEVFSRFESGGKLLFHDNLRILKHQSATAKPRRAS